MGLFGNRKATDAAFSARVDAAQQQREAVAQARQARARFEAGAGR